MKKLIMLVCCVIGYQVAMAQGGDRVEQHLKAMDEHLNLTDSQEVIIRGIMLETRDAMKGTQDRAQIDSIRKDSKERIKGVLTPEQQAKMKEHREEHKAKMDSIRGVRQDFDANLSAEEKQTIIDTRVKVLAIKEQLRDTSSDLSKEEREKLKTELKEALKALDPIIEQHQSELEALNLPDHEPKGPHGPAGMHGMKGQKGPPHGMDKPAHVRKQGKGGPGKMHDKEMRKNRRYYRFLLMPTDE